MYLRLLCFIFTQLMINEESSHEYGQTLKSLNTGKLYTVILVNNNCTVRALNERVTLPRRYKFPRNVAVNTEQLNVFIQHQHCNALHVNDC